MSHYNAEEVLHFFLKDLHEAAHKSRDPIDRQIANLVGSRLIGAMSKAAKAAKKRELEEEANFIAAENALMDDAMYGSS